LNFIGNVESKELFSGKVDVVVTDGFTGNVFLKTSEAVSKFLLATLKEQLMGNLQTKIGAAISKPAFDEVKKLMDPAEIGAVPLLGIDGLIFVGHGRSNARALVNAIRAAQQAVKADLLNALRKNLQETNPSPRKQEAM
jgi:glycerol-3-phosphate acyltransferase PlsX